MTMGEKLQKQITLPVWAITLIVGGVMTLFTINTIFANNNKQTEINKADIEMLKSTKADKEMLNLILDGQRRIETKLDTHIANNPK
jgi:hypothetical protein